MEWLEVGVVEGGRSLLECGSFMRHDSDRAYLFPYSHFLWIEISLGTTSMDVDRF